ncbi:MAG: glycosyltransferase [Acidobacteria bacterium]|nr:MAG: glycosyltransferase [Acidobacteriota bacterium]
MVDSPSSPNILLVFAKKPIPGTVKTRLAKDIGDEEAARLYRLMAERTWSRTAASGYDRWMVFEPPTEREAMQAWLPGAESYVPQVVGDLGVKLKAAFRQAFDAGARAVAVIATDTPEIAAADIHRTFALLETGCQAVMGPSTDGGYWLLALSRFEPGLFEEISWSTSAVAEQTRAMMARHGLRSAELRTLRDIDGVDDLDSLWKDLARPLSENAGQE